MDSPNTAAMVSILSRTFLRFDSLEARVAFENILLLSLSLALSTHPECLPSPGSSAGLLLRTWAIMIRADSSVALSMAKRHSSPHPSLNFLAAELTLRLEKFKIQRESHHHLRGSWNAEADWLSRLTERGEAVWKASNFWMKAPGDESAGDQKFTPESNIFKHLSVR